MKLRLPKALLSAMAAAVVAAAPLATTVGALAVLSPMVSYGGTSNDNVTISFNANGEYNTNGEMNDDFRVRDPLVVTGDKTISFGSNNQNLGIESLNLMENSSLTIKASACDALIINDLQGSGTLNLSQNAAGQSWGHSIVLRDGDASTEFTGVINVTKAATTPTVLNNTTVLFLMADTAAAKAKINLGPATTLAVSTGNAQVGGLSGADGAYVLSMGNPYITNSMDTLTSHKSSNTQINSYDTKPNYRENDGGDNGAARTLTLTGSGTYEYAGAIGSSTNADKLNITMTGTGTQYLNGTNYIGDLNVSGGTLVLGGTSTIAGDTTVSGGKLTLNGLLRLGNGKVIDNRAGQVVLGDGFNIDGVSSLTVARGEKLVYVGVHSATYGKLDLSDYFTSVDAAHLSGTNVVGGRLTQSFSSVIFNDGAILRVEDTQTIASSSLNIASNGALAVEAGSKGHLTINGGVTYKVGSWITESANGESGSISITGSYTLSGSSSEVDGNLTVDGSTILKDESTLTVNAGGNLTTNVLHLHNSNTGHTDKLTINGGVVNVESTSHHTDDPGDEIGAVSGIIIGHYPGGLGVIEIGNGGVLNAGGCTTVVSWNSSGELNINTGGEANVYGINNKGRNSHSTITDYHGDVNLSGGRLNVGADGYIGSGTNSHLNVLSGSTGSTLGILATSVSVQEDLQLSADLTIDTQVHKINKTGKSTAVDGSYGEISLSGSITHGTGVTDTTVTVLGQGTLNLSKATEGNFQSALVVKDGTLKITGAAKNFNANVTVKNLVANSNVTFKGANNTITGAVSGTGTITLDADKTLDLALTTPGTIANAMTLNGNLKVTGAKTTLGGTLGGTLQTLTVNKPGGLVLDGSSLTVATFSNKTANTGSVELLNGATLTINSIASNNQAADMYGPVSGGDGTGRLIFTLPGSSTWETSNIVSLDAGTKLKDVTITGDLALSQFGGNGCGSPSNHTDLQGNDLRLTNGSNLIIRENLTDGGNGNMGDIILEQNAGINTYGYGVSSNLMTLGNNIIDADGVGTDTATALTLTGNGGLTLTGRIEIDTLTVNLGDAKNTPELTINGTEQSHAALALSNAIVLTKAAMTIGANTDIILSSWEHVWNDDKTQVTYTIVNGNGLTMEDGVNWSVAGGTYSYADGVGTYTVSFTGKNVVDAATFNWGGDSASSYVNSVSSADNKNDVYFITDSVVTLGEDVTTSGTSIAKGVTVSLAGAHTLTAAGGMTLDGDLRLTSTDTCINSTTRFDASKGGRVILGWGGTSNAQNNANVTSLLTAIESSDHKPVLVIESGTRFTLTKETVNMDMIVEDGGHIDVYARTIRGDVTVSGRGVSNDAAINFNHGTIEGNVNIVGGRASLLSVWNNGYVKGYVQGAERESGSYASLDVTRTSGHIYIEGLRGVNTVNVAQSGDTVDIGFDYGGSAHNRGVSDFGDVFSKEGAGTLVIRGEGAVAGKKVIVNAGVLELTSGGGTAVLKNTEVVVNGGGTLKVGHDTLGYTAGQLTSSITMQGTSTENKAILVNNNAGQGGGNTIVTDITLKGYTEIQGSTQLIKAFGMDITAEGVENTIDTVIDMYESVTFTVDNTETKPVGALEVSQGIRGGDNAKSLTKEGAGTLTLSGANIYWGDTVVNAGTLEVTGSVEKSKRYSVSGNGEIKLSGEGTISIGTGAQQATPAVTLEAGAEEGVLRKTTIDYNDSTVRITGAHSEVDSNIQVLGEMSGMSLEAAASMDISYVTMYDSTINANGHSVNYNNAGGSRVMAVASTATTSGRQETRGVVPGPAESGLDGDNNATANSLTATTVQSGGTATGTLTVDVAYSLLDANRGKTLTWTILDGVDVSGLSLQLGDVLTTLVQNGKPVVTLEVNGTPQDFATVDFKNADYNLLAGCEGLQHATVILTVENVPEPTTGVLSVLALAALAARRRRK